MDEQDIVKQHLDKIIDVIDFAIEATNSQDDYGMGMRNGMRYVKSVLDGIDPQYEHKSEEACEWIKYDYRTVAPRNHDINNPYWRIPENRMNALKYCPYCGKKIEVKE